MLFGFLSLPNNWVYVMYEDGHIVNVANQDTLTEQQARYYKKAWELEDNSIVEVFLETSKGEKIVSYEY